MDYNGDGILAINAQLKYPSGVGINSIGEVFISDTNNYRIRKVSLNGTISTIVGSNSGYNGDGPVSSVTVTPTYLTVSSNGDIYFADGSMIRKVSNNIVTTVAGGIGDGGSATSAYISATSFEFSSSGEMLIADTYNQRIRKVLTNGTIFTIAGNGLQGYNGDGILATSAQLNNPRAILLLSNGEVIFSDTDNHRIRKIMTNGTIVTIAGTGIAGYSGDGSLAINAN